MEKRIHFEIVSRYDRSLEPAVAAVPFKKGELFPEQIRQLVMTNRTAACPIQKRITGFWPDGSVKWLLLPMLAELPANQETDYWLEFGRPDQNPQDPKVWVSKNDGHTVIENGSLTIRLADGGSPYLFEQIQTPDYTYEKHQLIGPVVTDAAGREYKAQIHLAGWEILEEGPVRAMLRACGKHQHQNQEWMDFSLLVTVWAGKPWINLDYQIINCEKDRFPSERSQMQINNEQAGLKYDTNYPSEQIRSISFQICPSDGGEETEYGLYTSGFNFHAKKNKGSASLREVITADTVVQTPNEMFPEVLFSIFLSDWDNGAHAVSAGIYQAYQNFPKAAEAGKEGIRLEFLPDTGTCLTVPQGVARTTRFYLYFHEPGMDQHRLVDRAHQFEMPPLPIADSEVFLESQLYDPYLSKECHPQTERFLYRYVDSRAKGLGMLNFGDGPEWEYIRQGRSGNRLIWINNEYDMPHNFMVMLARTGDRRYFDYMKAAAEHWYDVDLCHYSEQPYHRGLLYTHSVNHVSGQPVPSHQWVEGFLDYYHMTGNPNGLEAARSIGEGLLELMKLPIYNATATVEPREIGWAMRTFMALFRETGEARWKEACAPIVDVYLRWAKELGTWTTPYPDNYMDRVPFMIHVGIVGLWQYYEAFHDSQVRETILQVIDDMIRHCYIPRIDMFFGKQYPSVRFQNLNGMVLESLAIAYELTKDEDYMKKGMGMFSWITVENPPPLYDFSKYKEDDFTVIYNCPAGPKRCAQTLLPLLHYYRRAMELGYLK